MKIDYQGLHRDIIKKLNGLKISQRQGSKRIGVSRSTIDRIRNEKPLLLETYLKLTDWLEKDVDSYIIKSRRPMYIEKRLNTKKQSTYQ